MRRGSPRRGLGTRPRPRLTLVPDAHRPHMLAHYEVQDAVVGEASLRLHGCGRIDGQDPPDGHQERHDARPEQERGHDQAAQCHAGQELDHGPGEDGAHDDAVEAPAQGAGAGFAPSYSSRVHRGLDPEHSSAAMRSARLILQGEEEPPGFGGDFGARILGQFLGQFLGYCPKPRRLVGV